VTPVFQIAVWRSPLRSAWVSAPEAVASRESLANPEAFDSFVELARAARS